LGGARGGCGRRPINRNLVIWSQYVGSANLRGGSVVIGKAFAELKAHGPRGLLAAVYRRLVPTRLSNYRRYRRYFEGKKGLEIGGPSGSFRRTGLLPVYPIAGCIDNCNFGHHTVWEGAIEQGATFRYDKRRPPGTQYVAEATDLGHIASASYDFVLSSHTLEHVANPLQALSEWIRILKEDGVLALVVPHKDGTFDHKRPVTPLTHLVQDFEQNVTEEDLTHLDEILALHDLMRDPDAGNLEAFRQRSLKNLQNRCLHHHVFDTRLAVEMVRHMGLKILAAEAFEPYDILVIAQKPGRSVGMANHDVIPGQASCGRRSPFPSDKSSQSIGG
jgi:SAM-dependent methyltransferase